MNKRNLVEDLTICEAATPGPWKYNGNEVVATSKPFVGIAGAMSEEDCEFIAEAREGWPEAISRAIAAEEEVERMKEENTHLQEWRDRKYHVDDVSRSYWQRQTAKIKHLIPHEDKPGIGSIVEMLLLKESQLQDALNTLQWYADESSYEQEKTLYDENDPTDFYWEQPEIYEDKGARAKAAIQRIQEEGKQS